MARRIKAPHVEGSSSSSAEEPALSWLFCLWLLFEARRCPIYPASGHRNGSLFFRLALLYLPRDPPLHLTSLTAHSPAIDAGQPGPGRHRAGRKHMRPYRPKLQRNDLHRPPPSPSCQNLRVVLYEPFSRDQAGKREQVAKYQADDCRWPNTLQVEGPEAGKCLTGSDTRRATGVNREAAGPPSKKSSYGVPITGRNTALDACATVVATAAESAKSSGAERSTSSSALKSRS
ncbi:hypothetical protein RF11_10936 [Thelohanellus kitauei]|uniref:Uncharacterized protein n=1 Tax=Thelohanellus kitauei TaxID=669202 RepID=A0A0C2J564_THEKT|nr:hypothetical protein RF11_10936 [Thelohanellus kitauei]